MMNAILQSVVVLSVLGAAIAYPGQYVPRSYYVIDREGHQSDLVVLRTRRDLAMFPTFNTYRVKRGSGNGAFSSASASSSSSSSTGGGGDAPIFIDGPGFPAQGYNNQNSGYNNQGGGSGQGHHPGAHRGLNRISVGSDSGQPESNFQFQHFGEGPTLFARFGEDVGSSINAHSSAAGQKGSFSSSSSSVDSDGKITFDVKSGRY